MFAVCPMFLEDGSNHESAGASISFQNQETVMQHLRKKTPMCFSDSVFGGNDEKKTHHILIEKLKYSIFVHPR